MEKLQWVSISGCNQISPIRFVCWLHHCVVGTIMCFRQHAVIFTVCHMPQLTGVSFLFHHLKRCRKPLHYLNCNDRSKTGEQYALESSVESVKDKQGYSRQFHIKWCSELRLPSFLMTITKDSSSDHIPRKQLRDHGEYKKAEAGNA